MTDSKALTTGSEGLALSSLRGNAVAPHEILTSPASGSPCVHWRLRVFETVAARMELVHEMIAPEPFAVEWRPDPLLPPRRIRVTGENTRLEAQPIFHRPGSPGALAVARHFELDGRIRVEEVLVRSGEPLVAEGVLIDPEVFAAGPYRGGGGDAELAEATIRLPTGLSIRPALLPWALGTAAALLGLAGATTAASKLWKLGFSVDVQAEIGPQKVRRPLFP